MSVLLTFLTLATPQTTPIAYISTADNRWPQGRLMVAGIPKAKLPRIVDAREPSLSPDRTRVLYWANPKDAKLQNPIRELDLRTGRVRTVVNGNCRSPLWSADGKTIIFTQYLKRWELMKVAAIGSSKPSVFFSAASLYQPTRSFGNPSVIVQDMLNVYWVGPDGARKSIVPISRIAADRTAISSGDRFVAKPGASHILAYTEEAKGHKSVVDEVTGTVGAVFTYELHRAARKRITPETTNASHPCWSRDGKWIYFVSHAASRNNIMRIPSSGGKAELVAKNAGEFSL